MLSDGNTKLTHDRVLLIHGKLGVNNISRKQRGSQTWVLNVSVNAK